ncbi:MAG: hypothetical protein ABUL77_01500 [Bacteroidota bacterium]
MTSLSTVLSTGSSRNWAAPRRGRAGMPAPAVLAAALLGLACGNYSNEDLEFMSAIPQRDDVTVALPLRSSLPGIGIADGWKTTLEVTRGLNGTADAFLSLIEKVRTYYPTSRRANDRVWGPFPSDENPGWRVEFRMSKLVDLPEPRFTYALVMMPPAGVALPGNASETAIITGSFDAAAGVRVGVGHLDVTPEDARTAGVAFRGLEKLRLLAIDYNTRDWPRRVHMRIVNAPPIDPSDAAEADYIYERSGNGDGAMTFTFPEDVVDGPVGSPSLDETLMVESRWLGTGPGRADNSVTGGNLVDGATSIECWGEDFRQSYKFESWRDVLTRESGDPLSCIPRL